MTRHWLGQKDWYEKHKDEFNSRRREANKLKVKLSELFPRKKVTPEEKKEKRREYARRYYQKPEVKLKAKLKRIRERKDPKFIEKERIRQKVYCSKPEFKEKIRNYKRNYYHKPGIHEKLLEQTRKRWPKRKQKSREYQRKYTQIPEVKERKRKISQEVRKTEKWKNWIRIYRQKPEVKERERIKRQTPEYKQKLSEYKVKNGVHIKEYMKGHYQLHKERYYELQKRRKYRNIPCPFYIARRDKRTRCYRHWINKDCIHNGYFNCSMDTTIQKQPIQIKHEFVDYPIEKGKIRVYKLGQGYRINIIKLGCIGHIFSTLNGRTVDEVTIKYLTDNPFPATPVHKSATVEVFNEEDLNIIKRAIETLKKWLYVQG
jgi:hypothetical protein